MAGGNWTIQNKVLPGVYTNVVGKGAAEVGAGTRGIVAMPIVLPWLAEKTIVTVQADDLTALYNLIGAPMLPVREALKYAHTVLIYRPNEGVKATATAGNLTATAKYSGSVGNRLTVSIEAIPGNSGQYYVRTFLDGSEVDIQQAATAADVKANAYVEFSGTENLAANAGAALSGGADGTAEVSDYTAALAAFELHTFNAIPSLTTDSSVNDIIIAYVNRLRGEEGKNVQAVVPNVVGADSIAVISVKNGYLLADGTTVTAAQATGFVAGATAGVSLAESLTNAIVPDAVDVTERYTTSQLIDLVNAGQIAFIPSPVGGNTVAICKDINTLTTYTDDQPKIFAKNKVVRTLDAIADTIYQRGYASYIGKVPNTENGRMLFKSEIMAYLRELEAQEVIRDVTSEDITIRRGDEIDAVVVDYAVRPVDVMEKIYNTIVVSTV